MLVRAELKKKIHPCAVESQALSCHTRFLALYLCRAARGSADIPILPHTHTILLKHAVNLKRKRTLITTKLSSPYCIAHIKLSQEYRILPKLRCLGRAAPSHWLCVMSFAWE